MKEYFWLIFWVIVIGTSFGVAWYMGYLAKLVSYVQETKEELRKCTWPTTEELKGSTVVIMITTLLLGGFTVAVDFVITLVIRLIT